MHANLASLEQAAQFASDNTPRGWLRLALNKREEKALMNFKLGIKDDLIADCTDVKQVLERVRGSVMKNHKKASELTDFEVKALT